MEDNKGDQLHTQEYQVIRKVDRAILSSSTSAAGPLTVIVNEGRKLTGAAHSHVVVVQRDRLIVAASSGGLTVGHELPMDHSLCGKALAEQQDQHVADVEDLERQGRYHRSHPTTRSELALLIQQVGSSRILGILDLERDVPGLFDAAALDAARLLAAQAAIAIEKSLSARCFEALNKVSMELLQGDLTAGKAYRDILDAALEALSFEHGQVLMLDGEELIIIASSRRSDVGLRVSRANSACGQYLIAEGGRQILIIPDIKQGPYSTYYLQLLEADGQRPMQSEMIVPLLDGSRLVGALNIESPQLNAFSDLHKEMLGAFGGLIQRTAVAALSRSNRAARERIDSEQRAMTRLGYGAVDFLHQFRNHVGDIRGNLVYLRDHLGPAASHRVAPDASVSEFVDQLIHRIGGVREMIAQFAKRFDPQSPHYQPSEEDLVRVAERAVVAFRTRHPEEPVGMISVDVKLPSEFRGAQMVRARSVCLLTPQIDEVLADLLDNALRAIREKRKVTDPFYDGTITIVVDLPEPLYPRLTIVDNGMGIPSEHLEKIFDYSFSTKEHGSGLGLWLCKSYMHLQGGEVRVESAVGHSTAFELSFPLALTMPQNETRGPP
ncbi:MAG: GAF domain-containing protein [Pirellulales bacterium]